MLTVSHPLIDSLASANELEQTSPPGGLVAYAGDVRLRKEEIKSAALVTGMSPDAARGATAGVFRSARRSQRLASELSA